MPSRQRGFARKRGNLWLAVWREEGRERSRGGFETKTASLDYANTKADEAVARAAALRFGDHLPQPVSGIATVSDLVEAFLQRHRVDEATRKKLQAQLKHAKDARSGAAGWRRCSRSSSTSGAPRCRRCRRTTCSAPSGRCWSTRSRWDCST